MAARSAAGNSSNAVLDRLLLVGEVAERGVGGGDEALDRRRRGGRVRRSAGRSCGSRGRARRGGRRPLCSAWRCSGRRARSGAGRCETLLAAAADPLGAAGDQQLDVLAGVGVEGAEEGVEVGVRFGLGQGEVVRRLSTCSLPVPGSISTIMSLSPVFGRSRKLASGWIRSMYFGSMSMPTTAWPSSRSTEATLPIWMPAMSTAWPWPGGDRLGGRELGGDVFEFFADQGQPGGQRGFLLGEDPEHHHDAGERQDDDRDRVFAATADLAREPGTEVGRSG